MGISCGKIVNWRSRVVGDNGKVAHYLFCM